MTGLALRMERGIIHCKHLYVSPISWQNNSQSLWVLPGESLGESTVPVLLGGEDVVSQVRAAASFQGNRE